MGYDLFGPWDATDHIGPYVHGQTDMRTIRNDTAPLWFAKLPPEKINFGVAFYGRGYTLASSGCEAQADDYCFGGIMIWSIDFQDDPDTSVQSFSKEKCKTKG